MIIEINKKTKLSQLAEAFNKYYPFLKIEFFSDVHQRQEASDSNNLIFKYLTVEDITPLHHNVFIEIHFWNKTGTVELAFKQKAGLNVQVYRRNGDKWIQTSGTDELTLEEQNSIGKMHSEDILHGTNRINKL